MSKSVVPIFSSKSFIVSSPGGTGGKEPACQGGDVRDVGSIPGLGRSLGGGYENTLLYSCLKNPVGRVAK